MKKLVYIHFWIFFIRYLCITQLCRPWSRRMLDFDLTWLWSSQGLKADLPVQVHLLTIQCKKMHFWWLMINNQSFIVFFGMKGYVALDINLGLGYNTLIWWLILWDLLSGCPHKQFNTLPDLLDSGAALSHSYPNACMPCKEKICTNFIMNPRPTAWEADMWTTKPTWCCDAFLDWTPVSWFWIPALFGISPLP